MAFVEVGQTSLAVVPNMKGFRGEVNRASRGAADSGSKAFGKSWGDSSKRTGSLVGRNISEGALVGEKALRSLTQENARSTSVWSNARMKHLDQLGKERVAQAALGDAVKRYGEDSVQAIRAQETLASAQRRSAQTGEALAAATERMRAAQEALKRATEGVASASRGVFSQIGKDLSPIGGLLANAGRGAMDLGKRFMELRPVAAVADAVGNGWTRAGNLLWGVGHYAVKPVANMFSALGDKAGAWGTKFLSEHPRINGAFQSIRSGVQNTGTVFGSLGRASLTAAKSITSSLGSGLESLWSGMKTAIGDAGTFMTSALGGAAKITAGIITGVLGGALVKGFGRLTGIENAQAKMRGLGKSADEIGSIMESVNDAAVGTIYTLDEMANAAAGASNAGIKPGKEMKAELDLIANSATATGRPLADMGQIINSVTTKGRVGTMQLNQIAHSGVGIWQALADEYGVTGAEMEKMVTGGEVDAETFKRVMGELAGTVAEEMGGTTQGAIRNTGAALGRLGEKILEAPFPLLKDGALLASAALDWLGSKIGPLMQSMSEHFEAFGETMRGWTEGFKSSMDDTADAAEKPAGPLGGLAERMADFGPVAAIAGGALLPLVNNLPLIGRFLPIVTGPFGLLVGVLTAAYTASEPLRQALGDLAGALGGALMEVLPSVLGVFDALSGVISIVAEIIGDLLAAAIEMIIPLIDPLVEVVKVLMESFQELLIELMPLIEELGGALVEAFVALTPLFTLAAELIMQLVPVIAPLVAVVGRLIGAAIQLIVPLVKLIGAILPPIISLFAAVLPPVVALVGVIIDALIPIIDGLIRYFQGLIDFVTGVFTGNWEQAWNGVSNMFGGFVDAVKGLVGGLGKIIGGIKDTIVGVFEGVGTWLWDSGSALINGLVDGITAGFDFAAQKVAEGLDWIRGLFPFSPAKRGPFSGRGWTSLGDSGAAIVKQVASGMSREFGNISIPEELAEVFDGTAGVEVTLSRATSYGELAAEASRATAGGDSGALTVVVEGNADRETIKEAGRELKRARRNRRVYK